VMFDTSADAAERLVPSTFRDVAYASTRMLHAWRIPASIGTRAFIDASYTVGFPALELASSGTQRIVAIATGVGEAYRNLYRRGTLGESAGGIPIDLVAPEVDLKELGVDFTTASAEGLERAYAHGREMADRWLRSRGDVTGS
jgi:hypothetical protein